MAISGIDSTSSLSTLQAAVNAAKNAGASEASSSVSAKNGAAANKASGSAPSGAKPSSSSGQSSSTTEIDTYDDADTNKDGVVTTLEQATYDMKHPGEQSGSILDVKA